MIARRFRSSGGVRAPTGGLVQFDACQSARAT